MNIVAILSDRTRVIWYMYIPGGDWMATIESRGNGGFKLVQRFRYYRDNKAFDSDDRKEWSTIEGDDLQSGIDHTRMVVREMKTLPGVGESWELERGTATTAQFMEQFMKLPFVHAKAVSQAELDKMMRKP